MDTILSAECIHKHIYVLFCMPGSKCIARWLADNKSGAATQYMASPLSLSSYHLVTSLPESTTIKVYLLSVTKKIFFDMWKGHIGPTFKERGSLSNKIMLHKILKYNWVWENFREDYTTPALFAPGIMGTIWALIW